MIFGQLVVPKTGDLTVTIGSPGLNRNTVVAAGLDRVTAVGGCNGDDKGWAAGSGFSGGGGYIYYGEGGNGGSNGSKGGDAFSYDCDWSPGGRGRGKHSIPGLTLAPPRLTDSPRGMKERFHYRTGCKDRGCIDCVGDRIIPGLKLAAGRGGIKVPSGNTFSGAGGGGG